MRPSQCQTLPPELRQVKTMLSAQELDLLYRLARDEYRGAGEIIDGGAFLGGSTLALAIGVRDNAHLAQKAARVHSYDLFVADRFAAQFLPGFEEGRSTRGYYDTVIAPAATQVVVHEGDIAAHPWRPARPIEIFFIDVAKSWATNDVLLHQFFPHVLEGGWLIQQDYHWPHTPWISITMELLKASFEHVGSMPWATSFYRCTRQVDARALPDRLLDLGPARLLELARRAQVFEHGSREWTAQQCNLVSLCHSLGRIDEAIDLYESTLTAAPSWVEYFQYRPTLPVRI